MRQSQTSIHAVVPGEDDGGPGFRQLCIHSGGSLSLFNPSETDGLPALAERVAARLYNLYTIVCECQDPAGAPVTLAIYGTMPLANTQ